MTRGIFVSAMLLALTSGTLSMHPHFRSWLPTFDYQFMVATPSPVVYSKLHRPVDRPTMNRIRSAADVTADASRGPDVDFTSSKGPREHLLQVHSLLKMIQNALQKYGIAHPDQSVVV